MRLNFNSTPDLDFYNEIIENEHEKKSVHKLVVYEKLFTINLIFAICMAISLL